MGRKKSEVIYYIQFTNPEPYPPLEHSSRMFVEEGLRCTFFARSNELKGRITFHPLEGRSVRFFPSFAVSIPVKLEFFLFTAWVVLNAIISPPKLAYCSDPFSAPIGLILMKLGIPVVYHEHDSPDVGLQRFFLRTRQKLLMRAKAVVLPNALRLNPEDRNRAGSRLFEIHNMPSKHEVVALEAAPMGIPRIVYFGTLVPSRLPLSFLDALISINTDIQLDLIGYETSESNGFLDTLIEHSKSSKVRIAFHGAMPRREMLHLASGCDFGLLLFSQLENINERHMLGASNKLFDYHLAGLPILHNSSEIAQKTEAELGIYYLSEYQDLGQTLLEVRRSFSAVEKRQALQQRILTQLNYEHQFAPLLNELKSK